MVDESPDGPGEAADRERPYRAKPPLWLAKPEPPPSRVALAALGALALVVLGIVLVMLEGHFLSMPVGQTTVTVVEVQTGRPGDEGPASYRHVVEMPDGTKRSFVCERVHRPGERLLVTMNRGLLTGRIRLGAPYIVVALPAGSSFDDDAHSR